MLSMPAFRSDARDAPPIAAFYTGPERREPADGVTPWLAATLDELDHGMLLLKEGCRVVHANHAARLELDCTHPLQLQNGELRVTRPQDAVPFAEALEAANKRGLRRLLTVGADACRVGVSVVPLRLDPSQPVAATLVMLGKRLVCESLAVQGFARSHRLTAAETRVLNALCQGARPSEIATMLGVGIATIRTQIGSIRQKTGADSIRALVQQTAVLPPLMGVLRSFADAPAEAVNTGRRLVA